MNKSVANLQALTKEKHDTKVDDFPCVKRGTNEFARVGDRLSQIVIRKDKALIKGETVWFRRAYVRYTMATDYSNVGWVLNQDISRCMVCANKFHFFRRKHHCYICGNICCKGCCRGSLIMTEFRDFGNVPACVHCDQGQKEMSIIRQAKKATDYQSHLDDHHHSHHHHHQAHSSSSNFLPSLESLSVANSSPPCSKLGQVTHLTVDVGPQDQDEEGEKVEGDQEKEVSGRSHIFGLESENDEVRHPNEV